MLKIRQTFNISETANVLVPDKLGKQMYLLVTLGILMMVVAIVVIYQSLPKTIPLYFTEPWGEVRLANKNMIYLFPIVTTLVMIMNMSVGRVLTKVSPLLPKILSSATLYILIMMIVGLAGIIQSLIL